MNAFTVGNRADSAIALTDGLLRRLTMREITAVLAHEVSHVANNDMWVMGLADLVSRITSTLSLFGQMLVLINLPLLMLGGVTLPWLPLLLLVAAPTISALLQLALSRAREYDADLDGAQLTGDPAGLASALQKLERYQGGLLERVLLPGRRIPDPSLLRTHPHTEERVRRLLALAGQGPPTLPPPMQIPADMNEDARGRTEHSLRRPRWHWTGLWY
jgi:heat shock protein HtpX